MNKTAIGLTFILLIVSLILTAFSRAHVPTGTAAQTAQYRITFTSTWNRANHPTVALPAGAHFSSLVGATHNASVAFWATGENATDGIESMAETGGTALLLTEVTGAINAGTAEQSLQGSGLGSATGTITLTSVTVQNDFPLVTLVTMIAPSPEWFTGVAGLPLQDRNGNWITEQTVDVFPYDSGTDSGPLFTSSDMDTVPPDPISRLSDTELFAAIPIGSMTFTRLDVPLTTPTASSVPTLTPTATSTATATPTPTICPQATAERFAVDFVSPTDLLTQTLGVRIGNGDRVSITAPTGVYTATGTFSFDNPAAVTVDLEKDFVNTLRVAAHVRPIGPVGGCMYGNYTLSEDVVIVQGAGRIPTITPTGTPTPTTTPTPTLAIATFEGFLPFVRRN